MLTKDSPALYNRSAKVDFSEIDVAIIFSDEVITSANASSGEKWYSTISECAIFATNFVFRVNKQLVEFQDKWSAHICRIIIGIWINDISISIIFMKADSTSLYNYANRLCICKSTHHHAVF